MPTLAVLIFWYVVVKYLLFSNINKIKKSSKQSYFLFRGPAFPSLPPHLNGPAIKFPFLRLPLPWQLRKLTNSGLPPFFSFKVIINILLFLKFKWNGSLNIYPRSTHPLTNWLTRSSVCIMLSYPIWSYSQGLILSTTDFFLICFIVTLITFSAFILYFDKFIFLYT